MKKLFVGFFALSLLIPALLLTGCGSSGGGSSGDPIEPTVLSTFPLADATGVATNVKITASFDTVMKGSSITAASFVLSTAGTAAVGGTATLAPDGLSVVFDPTANLLANRLYVATLTTDVESLEGAPLGSDHMWSFTTGAAADTTRPTVLTTVPANGATAVALDANVTATFSEAMDPLTVTNVSVSLRAGSAVAGSVTSPLTTTATFNPTALLAPSTVYTATITTTVKDVAGNAMAAVKTWTFTTRALSALGPDPLDLGLAGTYAVLAKSGITTVPASAITGDIGISPIGAGALVGFGQALFGDGTYASAVQVTGKVYAANYAVPTPANLILAVGDMESAYTIAAALPPPNTLNAGGGELGGLTLVPGLYKFTSAVTISDDLTLAGNDNDVWIFQIGGTLGMAGAKDILLSGSSLSKNVFWQVEGAVTIGAGAHFEGIILGATGITLNTGASIDGRLLAQTLVTLGQATVTQPAP